MSVKIYENGAWRDSNTNRIYENGAWRDAQYMRAYENGAWVDKLVTIGPEVLFDKNANYVKPGFDWSTNLNYDNYVGFSTFRKTSPVELSFGDLSYTSRGCGGVKSVNPIPFGSYRTLNVSYKLLVNDIVYTHGNWIGMRAHTYDGSLTSIWGKVSTTTGGERSLTGFPLNTEYIQSISSYSDNYSAYIYIFGITDDTISDLVQNRLHVDITKIWLS